MMWRAAFFVLAVAYASPVAAQEDLVLPPVIYPDLPRQAADSGAFAPKGWKLEQSAKGDLNADGVDDVAFVLREDNPANVLKNDNLGENPFDTNPRILAAAFGKQGGYSLAFSNHTLVPRRESPTVDDFLGEGGLAIDRGSIVVTLGMFASAGTWETYNSTFRLRHTGKDFRLIGFDKTWAHRGSGEVKTTSINYLTGMAELTTGTIESDVPTSKKKRPIGKKALLTLDQIGDGLAFDPRGDAQP